MSKVGTSHTARTAVLPVTSLAPLILLAVIWGGSIPVIKLGLQDFPPFTLTFLRYLVAAPLFAWSLRHSWTTVRKEWRSLAWLGLIVALPGQFLQTLGVRYTTANAGTLLGATIPVWFVILGSMNLGQRLRLRQWVGLAAAVLGVGLIVIGDPRELADLWHGGKLLGNGLVLVSAFSVAAYYALGAGLARRVSPLVSAGGTSLFAALYLLPFSLWELLGATPHATARGVGALLYLAVGVTYVGMQIWMHGLQRVPASVAGVLQYLQPLVGITISALILHEELQTRHLSGAALVLLGIALVTQAEAKAGE